LPLYFFLRFFVTAPLLIAADAADDARLSPHAALFSFRHFAAILLAFDDAADAADCFYLRLRRDTAATFLFFLFMTLSFRCRFATIILSLFLHFHFFASLLIFSFSFIFHAALLPMFYFFRSPPCRHAFITMLRRFFSFRLFSFRLFSILRHRLPSAARCSAGVVRVCARGARKGKCERKGKSVEAKRVAQIAAQRQAVREAAGSSKIAVVR